MIYILTGIAKSGKTLISKEILEKYQISTFSTDYIMMMLYRGNNNLIVDIDASDSSVSKQLEPYIYGMIKTMIENKDTYLIEGVHFTPDFSRKLLNEFKENIRIIYLGYKDITLKMKLEELYKYKDTMNNPWLFDHQEQSIEEIVPYMIKESKRVFEECIKYNLNYVDIYNIDKQKESIIKALIGNLEERC